MLFLSRLRGGQLNDKKYWKKFDFLSRLRGGQRDDEYSKLLAALSKPPARRSTVHSNQF